MKVDVDKIWAENEFSHDPFKTSEIISTVYFSKYEYASEIEERINEWSLDDLVKAFEDASELYTYEHGDVEETTFSKPEYGELMNEFYEACNISRASDFFVKPNKKKMFF